MRSSSNTNLSQGLHRTREREREFCPAIWSDSSETTDLCVCLQQLRAALERQEREESEAGQSSNCANIKHASSRTSSAGSNFASLLAHSCRTNALTQRAGQNGTQVLACNMQNFDNARPQPAPLGQN
jgi:hypothetical protein